MFLGPRLGLSMGMLEIGLLDLLLLHWLRKHMWEAFSFRALGILGLDAERIKCTEDDEEEEEGWKLVHTEVFRIPRLFGLLSAMVACGMQLLAAALIAMASAAFIGTGCLEAGRSLTIFAMMSPLAGYAAARLMRLLPGCRTPPRSSASMAAVVPALVILTASPAVDGALSLLQALTTSSCLVLVGFAAAWRRSPGCLQIFQVNVMAREIPPAQTRLRHPTVICLWGGICVCCILVIALDCYHSSFCTASWRGQLGMGSKAIHGLLLVLLLLKTSAVVAVSCTCVLLQQEDYRWWWSSFLSSASSGGFALLYCLHAYPRSLETMMPLVGLLALVAGSVGFLASFLFVHRVYSTVVCD